jgi:hypothetical protein
MCSLVNRSPVPEHYAITLMIEMRTVIILLYGDAKDVSRLNSRVLAVMGANHEEVENTFWGGGLGVMALTRWVTHRQTDRQTDCWF